MQGNYLGVELGSTRVKAVLTDEKGRILSTGMANWEDCLVEGKYSYPFSVIAEKLQEAYSQLKKDWEGKTGKKLTNIAGMGISAMMHGFLALDEKGEPIAPFFTWRNTYAHPEAVKLSKLFGKNVPNRYSIAHLDHFLVAKRPGLERLAHMTTLAGYVHYLLSGKFVLGMGDASGMFPLQGKDYDPKAINKFEGLPENADYGFRLDKILPQVLSCGEEAGRVTPEGALLLDPEGDLHPGTVLVPPEGDASTGMVFSNALRPGEGNLSVGTSIFLMAILEKNWSRNDPAIDIVSTPDGHDCAMIHANSCSEDLNAYMSLFKDYDSLFGREDDADERFSRLFQSALKEKGDLGIYDLNFMGGEPLLGIEDGRPMLVREKGKRFCLPRLMKSLLYSTFNTIAIGMDSLVEAGVELTSLVAHGGLFRTEGVLARLLSSALNLPVILYANANAGGPYGMALLALYHDHREESLPDFLKTIFQDQKKETYLPDAEEHREYRKYLVEFRKCLSLENAKKDTIVFLSPYDDLKERVYQQNLELVRKNLVLLTWGNVSEYDRERKVIAIKPSGVDYQKLRKEDIVVVDIDGNIVEGKLRPSSDLKTHLMIYRHFPAICGVTHTHSTYAVAFAQAGRDVPPLGTTHADSFHGPIPCARDLTKEEVETDYEGNSGKVIVECFQERHLDPVAMGAILLRNHGPFTFGKNAEKSVENAYILEEVCRMAYLTLTLNPRARDAKDYVQEKHYQRKHGKNACYGQN